MNNERKTLAIIPARSGSKGLKNKNIKLLGGKPLIAHTIEAALKSECFDEVMVSTDSKQYSEIAKEYGAKVPFLRSTQNSVDTASSWDTVLEVLDCYKNIDKEYTHICLLQPTSPLRDENDIKNAFTEMERLNAEAIVSVSKVDHTPLLSGMMPEDGSLNGFILRTSDKRRQDMGDYYRINGAIYLVDIAFLRQDTFLYREGCYGLVMDQNHSVDIDGEIDFLIAETILKKRDFIQEI